MSDSKQIPDLAYVLLRTFEVKISQFLPESRIMLSPAVSSFQADISFNFLSL